MREGIVAEGEGQRPQLAHGQQNVGATPTSATTQGVLFTVDLEDWYHALKDGEPPWWTDRTTCYARLEERVQRLLGLLKHCNVQGLWFVLGKVATERPELVRLIVKGGHKVGSHGYWHRYEERRGDFSDALCVDALYTTLGAYHYAEGKTMPYRSPYWSTTPRPGWCGGFFFRALPYRWLRWEVRRAGMFYVHPHDLRIKCNSEEPLSRGILAKNPWGKLERLLREVKWRAP